MVRRTRPWLTLLSLAVVAFLWSPGATHAINLDKEGDIRLGARLYTNVRVGTQTTNLQIESNANNTRQLKRSQTFPHSKSGAIRQQRTFFEAEFDHDLMRLIRTGVGPLFLLNKLPFKLTRFKYHLTFRSEYEGIYDYGGDEYATSDQYRSKACSGGPNDGALCVSDSECTPGRCVDLNELGRADENQIPCFSGTCATDPRADGQASIAFETRQRLRDKVVFRNRLFQAYIETQMGDVIFRLGRQILVWGETDAFRLLDNINPTDSSFGGFLIPLDERRVPLDMLLANYYLGALGPIYEAYIEAYCAIDNAVSHRPGIPQGSAWGLPNTGTPSTSQFNSRDVPARNFADARGSFQIKFNAPVGPLGDATFGFAHYYTYVDIPQVEVYVDAETPGDSSRFPQAINEGAAAGFQAWTVQRAPLVQITGATTTFAIPARWARKVYLGGEPIIRSELAYFNNEPRHQQERLDPFVFSPTAIGCTGKVQDGLCTAGTNPGSSWNFVIGVDMNQWIRFLNPQQSFFFTTQFFYKHLNNAADRHQAFSSTGQDLNVETGEVIPVPRFVQAPPGLPSNATQPVLARNPTNQFLQTLLISTSYYSGQINPSLTVFYDWAGALLISPRVQFSRDPFRFVMSYDYLKAGHLVGGSGISLLRDRDNFLFQVEYAL